MKVSTYNSFDALIDGFIEKTSLSLPRMTYGRKAFLSDIGRWANDNSMTPEKELSSYILPNPSQGLSFPNAGDIISSAIRLSANRQATREEILQIMQEYSLPIDKLTQPVTTLSGGEILLLNYAKASAMVGAVNSLSACSPTYWLNKNKYTYWEKLRSSYSDKDIEVFLMAGEPFPGIAEDTNKNDFKKIESVAWNMKFEEIKAVFEEITFPTFHPESSISYKIKNSKELLLSSPTLLTGDNGVGKSVFSKLISGIIKNYSQTQFSIGENLNKRVRLLFQDPINQLFAKSTQEHTEWVFAFSRDLQREAERIKDSIYTNLSDCFSKEDMSLSLLNAKATLVSERLATKPSLLILDEPGWGLSKRIGQQFIWSTCKEASKLGVAMMFISHRPDWWQGLVKSHIHLSRVDKKSVVIESLGAKNE